MGKDKRKLTKAEQLRKAEYEKKKKELSELGYEAKDLTISILYANVMAIVFTLPIIIVLGILFIYNNQGGRYLFTLKESMIFLVALIALIVAHELIHGLFWGIYAKNHFKSIQFGVIMSSLTPYCCCKEMLTKWQYIVGGIMPTVILGIIPAVVSIFTGSFLLFAIGELMILSGGGDITILVKLIGYKSDKSEKLYMDHPYECGLVVFEK